MVRSPSLLLTDLSTVRLSQTSHQTECHTPFSAPRHVGDDMSNMSCHDVMSRHVVMSCHVVTLETDPCVCHCQYSPTHVKDQNPCLCAKCHFQPSHHPPQLHLHVGLVKVWLENAQIQTTCLATPISHDKHVNENMSRHVMIPWSKSTK